jgi:16S rRNA (uracil1498-N3)-methyltransferase
VTANQFYVPEIAEGADRIVVDGAEHRHLARSARVRPGETVWLIDSAGRRALARVERVGERSTELAVLEAEPPDSPGTRVVLAQALVEAKKLEWILEKAAELGCADFVPVVTARSLRSAADRTDRKLERWARIVREAAKQCKGRLVTAVHPPRRLKELLSEAAAGSRLFLSENGGRPLREIVAGTDRAGARRPASVVLLVGPTGGWTAAEERDIREAGFTAVSLGARVLRAETAAVAGAAMIVHFWNE